MEQDSINCLNCYRMLRYYSAFIATLFMLGCTPTKRELPVEGNAVYYWQTTFSLDAAETRFLQQHHIKRIYCRYFDVVNHEEKGAMPNATIIFNTKVPDSIDIVPTVFIMNDCMQGGTDSLASKIVRRIVQMNETNDIKGVREIQIDCDFTARNRNTYYQFLEEVRSQLSMIHWQLSATIRLHQLSMPEPPVDYGVLMLYNTGEPECFAERNPILDIRDVKPYIKHLKGYKLPLAAAYPVFLWQRNVYGVNIEHVASFDEVMSTKQIVEAERNDLRHCILTYHLDTENINRYTTEQYEAIYHH